MPKPDSSHKRNVKRLMSPVAARIREVKQIIRHHQRLLTKLRAIERTWRKVQRALSRY